MVNFNTWRSLIDGSEVSAIPDSAVSQYDARDLALSDGDTVSSWPDSVGTNDLSAGGGPTFRTSEINGNPAVVYDGVDDYHNGSSDVIQTPYTILAVVRFDRSDLSQNSTFFSTANLSSDDGFGTGDGSDQDFLRFGSTLRGASSDNNNHLMTAAVAGSNGYLRRDGAEDASGDAGSVDIDGLTLGRREGGDDRYWLGPIGFLEVHNERLSGSDLTDRENEVADAFGISI